MLRVLYMFPSSRTSKACTATMGAKTICWGTYLATVGTPRQGYRKTYMCRLQEGGAQRPHLPTYARLRRDARKRAEIDAVAAVDPASSGLAKHTAESIFAPTMTKFLSAGYTRKHPQSPPPNHLPFWRHRANAGWIK